MKKNIIAFLMKNTFWCWTRLKNLLGTDKKLTRRNSVCCLKNQTIFFHTANGQKGLTTSSPCSFTFAFWGPPSPLHDEHTFSMPPKMTAFHNVKIFVIHRYHQYYWQFSYSSIFTHGRTKLSKTETVFQPTYYTMWLI